MKKKTSPKKLQFVFDGDCWICKNYQAYISLKKKHDIEFVDARKQQWLMHILKEKWFNINEWMVMIDGDNIYQWKDAIKKIQSSISPANFFDRILYHLSTNSWLVKLAYPVVNFIRQILLVLEGKKVKIKT